MSLRNAVRMQGGAYGCEILAEPTGFIGCNSFRDPNAARTLGCYKQCGTFLNDFLVKEPDLTGYIIGTVAQSDPLLTSRMMGLAADSYYWQGITPEDLNRMRQEILSISPKDLKNLAEVLKTVSNQSSICVLGSSQQLDRSSKYLEHIISL